jgi:hypothetical protein
MPRRTTTWLGEPASASPPKLMAPFCGRRTPAIMRTVVDFPAPLAPSRATISPGCTVSDTSRTASAPS